MWQCCPHTFHFATSSGGSRGLLTILCPPLPLPTGTVRLTGSSPPPRKGHSWVRILYQSDLELLPQTGEVPIPALPQLSCIFSPPVRFHILSFLQPHIKNLGFSNTGLLFSLAEENTFSQAIISYPKKILVKWKPWNPELTYTLFLQYKALLKRATHSDWDCL